MCASSLCRWSRSSKASRTSKHTAISPPLCATTVDTALSDGTAPGCAAPVASQALWLTAASDTRSVAHHRWLMCCLLLHLPTLLQLGVKLMRQVLHQELQLVLRTQAHLTCLPVLPLPLPLSAVSRCSPSNLNVSESVITFSKSSTADCDGLLDLCKLRDCCMSPGPGCDKYSSTDSCSS